MTLGIILIVLGLAIAGAGVFMVMSHQAVPEPPLVEESSRLDESVSEDETDALSNAEKGVQFEQ